MTASEAVRRVVLAGLLLASGAPAAAHAAEGLVASWAVQVDGDETQRTLRITRVEPQQSGASRVAALIGYRGQRLVPQTIELGEADGALTLRFTTPLGAQVDVRQMEDGSFRGQWTVPSGPVRAVQLVRMAPGEDTATAAAHYIVKPGAVVPARCAGFSGLWEGEWIFGARGKAWIWVLEIDANCLAKVAMQRELKRPTGFRTVQIGDGVMVLQLPDGTDVYKLVGDEMRANATKFQFYADNRGLFKRVADTLP